MFVLKMMKNGGICIYVRLNFSLRSNSKKMLLVISQKCVVLVKNIEFDTNVSDTFHISSTKATLETTQRKKNLFDVID